MSGPEIPEWINRARAGDRTALGSLLAHYRPRLRQWAGDLPDASDVVQDALHYVVEHVGDFRGTGEAEFWSWLRRILTSTVVNRSRRDLAARRGGGAVYSLDEQVVDPPADDSSSPSRRLHRAEVAERLARALDALPPKQREAVRLKHLEGWSLADIAGHLGCAPTAAGALVARGMKSLRQKLCDEEASP